MTGRSTSIIHRVLRRNHPTVSPLCIFTNPPGRAKASLGCDVFYRRFGCDGGRARDPSPFAEARCTSIFSALTFVGVNQLNPRSHGKSKGIEEGRRSGEKKRVAEFPDEERYRHVPKFTGEALGSGNDLAIAVCQTPGGEGRDLERQA